jgi:hypothetical protein
MTLYAAAREIWYRNSAKRGHSPSSKVGVAPGGQSSDASAEQTRSGLENTGIFTLRDVQCPPTTTILVIGVARGGTSLAAGVLHRLGLFMGDLARSPVFEDVKLAGALEGASRADPAAIIADYDSRHPRWGFKRPDTLAKSLSDLLKRFRNPRLVLVCKDLAAIADRRRISSLVGDQLSSMRAALRDYGSLLDSIAASDVPVLVMSADKAIANREAAVDALARFAGLVPDATQRSAAIGFISNRPAEYLDKARVRTEPSEATPRPISNRDGRPDFVCIGSQRAGTSWLASALRTIPGVSLPHPAALHWLGANWIRGEAWYRQCFSGLHGIRGEVSPSYAIATPEKITALSKICPSARILLVVRHPIRRAWSAIAAHLARKHPGPWRQELLAPALALAGSDDMSARSDYAAIAQAWSGAFPSFGVLFYEDLHANSAAFLDQALERLGIPPLAATAPRPLPIPNPNAGPCWAMPAEVEDLLLNRLDNKRLAFEKWLGRPIPAWD